MADFKNSDRFGLTDRFVMSHVGAETVLAPVSDSTADMGQLVTINPTGADILDGIREGLDFGGIVNKIMMLYEVSDRQSVEGDVAKFINRMTERGVVAPL